MQRPRSTPPSRLSTTSKCSSGRPGTARNHNVVALETGFYPQPYNAHHGTLMRLWAIKGYQWFSCSNGQMPSRAVQNGHSRAGEPLYVARALSPEMTQCLGIFHPSSGQCYFFWNGREYRSNTYEILCKMPKLRSRATPTATSVPALCDSLKIMTLRNPLKLSNFGPK